MMYEAARVRHDKNGKELADFPQQFENIRSALEYVANTPVSIDGNRPWIRSLLINDFRKAFLMNGGRLTASSRIEAMLQGVDPFSNSIVGFFLARGWNEDRIVKNIASKLYSPHRATIRVTFDAETKEYWVHGEYISKGENVLSACCVFLKETATNEEITVSLATFLTEAESLINNSFAVRFLGQP